MAAKFLYKIKRKKWDKPIIFGYTFIIFVSAGLLIAAQLQTPNTANAVINSEALTQLTSSLAKTATIAKGESIHSDLGFTTMYDATTVKARAQVTDLASTPTYVFGEEFEGDELRDARDYSMFIFEVNTPAKDDETITPLKARLNVSTNIRDTYFTSKEALAENQGKSKIDILLAETTKNKLANTTNVTASEPVDVVLAGISYKKVLYTTTYPSVFETDEPYTITDQTYMTVQNGRPYWASIALINKQNSDQVPLLEPIIAATQYSVPKAVEGYVAGNGDTFTAVSSNVIDIPKGGSYIPNPIAPETTLPVVLKNQPAVVRIGAINCIDAELRNASGVAVISVKKACAAGIGSGSIVSSDGYIATNGHVVKFAPSAAISEYSVKLLISSIKTNDFSELDKYLQYYIDTGLVKATATTTFISQLRSKDPAAIATLQSLSSLLSKDQLSVTSQAQSYIVQTSNEPIRLVDATTPSDYAFAYTSTNKEAKFVDANYDETVNLAKGYGSASDVAILKMEGSNYPVVTLGSISSVTNNSRITAIGFPAFVDNGVLTKQEKTVPAVTQGVAKEIGASSVDVPYKLILTTVPISGGNSGGPAFNDAGEQVGLNTYGLIKCADKNCFGDGIARDVEDYKQLVSKNNITLNTTSATTTEWNAGLDAFVAGNYKGASASFKKVNALYPSNYLAVSLQEIASSRIGGSDDTSSKFELSGILVTVAIAVFALGTLGVVTAVLIVRSKRNEQPAAPVAGFDAMPPVAPGIPAAPATPILPVAQSAPTLSSAPVSPFTNTSASAQATPAAPVNPAPFAAPIAPTAPVVPVVPAAPVAPSTQPTPTEAPVASQDPTQPTPPQNNSTF